LIAARACLLVAVASLGCDRVLGTHFDHLQLRPETAEAGEPDTAGGGCIHASPPPRPATAVSGGSIQFTIAQAVTSFGDDLHGDGGPGYETVGFDIDHTCTGETQGASCLEPDWATNYVDGQEGRDNATGKLWAQLRRAGMEPEGGVQTITSWDVLARVSDYNGQPDDAQVTVEFFWGMGVTNPDRNGVPRWDGTDEWAISAYELGVDAQGVPSLDMPKYVDREAYVSGSFLVARQPTFPLGNPGLLPRTAYDVVWGGHIVQTDAGAWELHDGVQSARLPLREVFGTLSGYADPFDPSGILCTKSIGYTTFKVAICSFVDISSSVDDPSRPCDALSNGSTFQGYPARLGPIDTTQLAMSRCAPEVDPANDSCDTLP
jgi:hypothetical protein